MCTYITYCTYWYTHVTYAENLKSAYYTNISCLFYLRWFPQDSIGRIRWFKV